MSDSLPPDETKQQSEFEREASQNELGIAQEFWLFLRENKKWWLLPLVCSLLLIGLISLLATGAAAPFIYTLF